MVEILEFIEYGVYLTPSCSAGICRPYSFSFLPGVYRFELWGGSGGGSQPGYGGYVSGSIQLNKRTTLYLFIGQKGIDGDTASWNGGGSGCSLGGSGGGSTDVRIINGSWSDFESLKSRIIVAGGGGGSQISSAYLSKGGDSGGIEGSSGNKKKLGTPDISLSTGGKQDSGGNGGTGDHNGNNGGFGYGGIGSIGNGNGNGGGSGYFGGGGSATSSSVVGSGAGGSSYISGYSGCMSIDQSSTAEYQYFSNISHHYSGYYFFNTTMLPGGSSMPIPYSNQNSLGWDGDGTIRISLIKSLHEEIYSCDSICHALCFLVIHAFSLIILY